MQQIVQSQTHTLTHTLLHSIAQTERAGHLHICVNLWLPHFRFLQPLLLTVPLSAGRPPLCVLPPCLYSVAPLADPCLSVRLPGFGLLILWPALFCNPLRAASSRCTFLCCSSRSSCCSGISSFCRLLLPLPLLSRHLLLLLLVSCPFLYSKSMPPAADLRLGYVLGTATAATGIDSSWFAAPGSRPWLWLWLRLVLVLGLSVWGFNFDSCR